jgi:GNAT superfamily N-acetyltransferase
MTQTITIRNYQTQDIEQLAAFFTQYRATFPDAKLLAPEFYMHHPALAQGQNVFCALTVEQQIVGFMPLFPLPVAEDAAADTPHQILTVMIVDPARPDAADIRTRLFTAAFQRAQIIKQNFTKPRTVRLAADYMISQTPDIEDLKARGFQPFEGLYLMRRAVAEPCSACPIPPGIAVRHRKLDAEPEQQNYLQAFNRCFPGIPKTLEELRFLLNSPLWGQGMALNAFDAQDHLVASILVYRDPEYPWGMVDDVFVLPEWRGQGLAKMLIKESIAYFQAQGITEARLEVRKRNAPAVAVYTTMGFETINEEVLLGLEL